jgi:hypothetical protein
LAENYNDDKFRFEFKTFGARNQALKVLDRAGFDYELVEDLGPFVVKISGYSKYAPLLKNSISFMETAVLEDIPDERHGRCGGSQAIGRGALQGRLRVVGIQIETAHPANDDPTKSAFIDSNKLCYTY